MNRRVRIGGSQWILCACVVLLASCETPSEGPPTYPVQGMLMIDGQPAKDAQVILHPVGGENFDERGARPTGKVQADGSFELTTYHPRDGAPAGQYVVTIYWAENPAALEPSPDRLKGRFLNPAQSSLNVTIEEEATELPKFDLQTR